MINIAIVGSEDFNLVGLFEKTMDCLQQQHGSLSFHLVNRNTLLSRVTQEYVFRRPGCKIHFANTYTVGKYGEMEQITNLATMVGRVVYFLRPQDFDLSELMRALEQTGVEALGILWE